MHMTDTHFVITVPRLAGYKTLVVNAILFAFGILVTFYPSLILPDATAVGAAYDTLAGGVAIVAAAINFGLRLLTTTPAGPLKKRTEPADKPDGPELRLTSTLLALDRELSATQRYPSWPTVSGVRHASSCALRFGANCDCIAAINSPPELNRPIPMRPGNAVKFHARDIASPALADTRIVREALTEDAAADTTEHGAACGWPHCACHQRCKNGPIALDVASDGEPIVQLTTEELLRDRAARSAPSRLGVTGMHLRQFVAALLLPSVLMFGAVGVATLGGCASAKEVSAVVQAETLEQRAFALYGTFVVLEERAADLVRDRSIPKAVRKRIQDADRVAKPLADQVRSLAVQLNAARMAFNTRGAGADRVAAVSGLLTAALQALAGPLSQMQAAVASGAPA